MKFEIIAAIIPTVMFLGLILYYTVLRGGGYTPKVIKTKEATKIIGLSTRTSDESFVEDDTLLWKEFKRIKSKHLVPNKTEIHSFVSIKMNPKPGEKTYEYLMGRLVHSNEEIPPGFKTIEVPKQHYVAVNLTVRNEKDWTAKVTKLETYLIEKWLPDTEYELNVESPVKTVVYHDKRTETTTRAIIYYLAVKEKKKEEIKSV